MTKLPALLRNNLVVLQALPALLFAFSSAAPAQIPSAVVPEGVGVQIPFTTGHERDLDMIAAAGVKVVRVGIEWEKVESRRGVYNWSKYDELLRHLKERGLRALLVLAGSHALYEPKVKWTGPTMGSSDDGHLYGTAAPHHADSVTAFVRWSSAAADHFRGQGVIWELWNEPNAIFWLPKPDVHDYTTLALATAKAIRSTDPNAVIVGPALSGPFDETGWEFLTQFLSSGILQWLDAVTIHSYLLGGSPPEDVSPTYKRLRKLIDQYAPAGRSTPLPILSGEWGYSSDWDGSSKRTDDSDLSVTPQMQADFLVRQQIFNLASGVPLTIWFEWTDNDQDPHLDFRATGLVTSSLQPKPAYFALRAMTRELNGFHFERRVEGTSSNKQDFIFLFADPSGDEKIVAWTRSKPHRVTYAPKAGAPRSLALSGTPIYEPQ